MAGHAPNHGVGYLWAKSIGYAQTKALISNWIVIIQCPDLSEPATQVVLELILLKCPFCPSCGRYGINVRGCADNTKLKYNSRSLIFVGISLQEATCTRSE